MKNQNRQVEINPAGENGFRWVENIGTAWRFIGFADEINTSIRHKGWFTSDDFQDEVMRGVVYRLPTRKHKPVYAVGYYDPNNDDCAYVRIDTSLENDFDAANEADRIAERLAEKEREYNASWQLGRRYNDALETIQNERAARKELFTELRSLKHTPLHVPALCKIIRDRIKKTRRTILEAYRERREIISNHYFRSDDLLNAFADGAEITSDDAAKLFYSKTFVGFRRKTRLAEKQ